jgi:hypothetical protein
MYSRQGIELAREVGYRLIVLQGLFARAELLAKLGQSREAAELCSVIREHPAATEFERKLARTMLSELSNQLTVQQVLVLEATVKQRSSEQNFYDNYIAAVIDAVFTQKPVPV